MSVGRAPIRKDDGSIIDVNDVTRRAQATNGTFVPLGDDEIAAATIAKGQCIIETFVPVKFMDSYLPVNQVAGAPRLRRARSTPTWRRRSPSCSTPCAS